MSTEEIRQVRHNRDVHDLIVSQYDSIHTEIFNPTEQRRIESVLAKAISDISGVVGSPLVLDYGAGTGNLTRHLLNSGASVVAADVSPKCLDELRQRFPNSADLKILELNGVDLSTIEDNRYDMVATYSVLHHVPDYCKIIREFARVVKPGGIIYIDHEVAPSYWQTPSEAYRKYTAAYRHTYSTPLLLRASRKCLRLLSPSAWKRVLRRTILSCNSEGDIHVHKHDHIDWHLIDRILSDLCVCVRQQDYLVCREMEPVVYREYKDKCSDMRYAVYRKVQARPCIPAYADKS